jgi:hypothetical protein
LITRLESYTKDGSQSASSRHAEPPAHDPASGGVRAQLAWDVMLGLCSAAYLVLVLFDDVQSPLLSIALIFLVAYELIQPHLRSR